MNLREKKNSNNWKGTATKKVGRLQRRLENARQHALIPAAQQG